MEFDTLQEFQELRQSLLDEKANTEDRLHQLTEVLKDDEIQSPTKCARSLPKLQDTNKQLKNNVKLREAGRQITFHRPLTRDEILTEIRNIGYKLSTRPPKASLNLILH